MTIDGFDYKSFAENLYEQSITLVPDEFSSEDRIFVSDTLLKFAKIAGEALNEGNEFNSEQAEFVTQVVAEWTFHKSVDFVKSGIPREFWEPALQKIAMVIFEVAKNGIRQEVTEDSLLSVIETHVKNTYRECIKDIKNKNLIDEAIFKQAMEQSNIDIMAENACDDADEQSDNDTENKKSDDSTKSSNWWPFISHTILALILCFGTPFVIDKAWGIFGGNIKLMLVLGFLIFSFVIFKFNKILEKDINEQLKKLEEVKKNMQDLVNPDRCYNRLGVDILKLQVGYNLLKIADPDLEGLLLPKIAAFRQRLADDLGYIIPNIRIMDDTELDENEYCIFIHDKKVATGVVYPDKCMVLASKWDETGNNLPEDVIIAEEPVFKVEAYWINKDIADNLENINAVIPEDVIITHLRDTVIKNADKVLSYEQTCKYIELVKSNRKNPVKDVLKLLSVIDIKNILAGLIKENVSIKDIVLVFELLSDYARETKDINVLIEKLKKGLE